MEKPHDRLYETNNTNPDFEEQIDAILNRGLSPENIDTYADQALEDLVELVEKATLLYSESPTIHHQEGLDNERAAFAYFGLDPEQIEGLLDHIVKLSSKILKLDDFIKNAASSSSIITPPDSRDVDLEAGSSSFKYNEQSPRLKTILLLLQEKFGIDIQDKAQLVLTKGNVEPKMMRRMPYNLLDIPVLNRIALVCDEKGNRTFILNRSKLFDANISVEEIIDYPKSDLNNFIAEDTERGVAIQESVKYVQRIADSLTALVHADTIDPIGKMVEPNVDKLLAPSERLRGRYTINEMKDRLGISYHYVQNIVKTLPVVDVIESVKNKPSLTYDASVMDTIVSHPMLIEKRGHPVPEGVKSMAMLALELDNKNISKYARKYHMPLGKFAFDDGKRSGFGIFSHDEAYIKYILQKAGGDLREIQPDETTLKQVAADFNISTTTLKKKIAEKIADSEEFGDIILRKSNRGAKIEVLTASQIDLLGLQLVERAPEGIVSALGMTKLLRPFDYMTVSATLKDMVDEGDLQQVGPFKFGANTSMGYRAQDAEQVQRRIIEKTPYLENRLQR